MSQMPSTISENYQCVALAFQTPAWREVPLHEQGLATVRSCCRHESFALCPTGEWRGPQTPPPIF